MTFSVLYNKIWSKLLEQGLTVDMVIHRITDWKYMSDDNSFMIKKGIDSYDLFLITTTPIGNDEKLNLPEIAKMHPEMKSIILCASIMSIPSRLTTTARP